MIIWKKKHRWLRYINGQMVSLVRSDAGLGTYTDAITNEGRRIIIADLVEWANQEFPGIPTRELDCEEGFIGITIATFV